SLLCSHLWVPALSLHKIRIASDTAAKPVPDAAAHSSPLARPMSAPWPGFRKRATLPDSAQACHWIVGFAAGNSGCRGGRDDAVVDEDFAVPDRAVECPQRLPATGAQDAQAAVGLEQ